MVMTNSLDDYQKGGPSESELKRIAAADEAKREKELDEYYDRYLKKESSERKQDREEFFGHEPSAKTSNSKTVNRIKKWLGKDKPKEYRDLKEENRKLKHAATKDKVVKAWREHTPKRSSGGEFGRGLNRAGRVSGFDFSMGGGGIDISTPEGMGGMGGISFDIDNRTGGGLDLRRPDFNGGTGLSFDMPGTVTGGQKKHRRPNPKSKGKKR
jgi:hypothetical protein